MTPRFIYPATALLSPSSTPPAAAAAALSSPAGQDWPRRKPLNKSSSEDPDPVALKDPRRPAHCARAARASDRGLPHSAACTRLESSSPSGCGASPSGETRASALPAKRRSSDTKYWPSTWHVGHRQASG